MNTLVINKEDLRHNINKIKEYAKKSGQDDAGKDVKIIAVVKGNGYGMGIVEYTKFLIDNGISMFAVSSTEIKKRRNQRRDFNAIFYCNRR